MLPSARDTLDEAFGLIGCIDPGMRDGRHVVYCYHHFLQALLVRRLLADGVPARRMPELIVGRHDEELKCMIFGGVEVVAREGGDPPPLLPALSYASIADITEEWTKYRLGDGVELNLRDKRPRLSPEQRRRILEQIEQLLRRRVR